MTTKKNFDQAVLDEKLSPDGFHQEELDQNDVEVNRPSLTHLTEKEQKRIM
jgi:hypothetical protein